MDSNSGNSKGLFEDGSKKVLVNMVRFVFYARGDPRITALHPTTLEVTKEGVKSDYGDCIVATSAEVGLANLPEELKHMARQGAGMVMVMEVGGRRERIHGKGHPSLTFQSEDEMVIRKSQYVCKRTLMVSSDKAAADLNRTLVEELKNPDNRIKITLIVGEE
jgi:hypothetical protein